MQLFFKSPDLYTLIVQQKFGEAKDLIDKGEKIPPILYKEVTWHDSVVIFEFLLEHSSSEKQHEMPALAVFQGATACLDVLLAHGMDFSLPSLHKIVPRKNQDAVKFFLESHENNIISLS